MTICITIRRLFTCIILSIAMVSNVVSVKGQDFSDAYDFLNITSSVRIYGLGGVNISTVEDNIEVADQNPALLGPEMGGWIDFNYMRYINSSNFAGLKYGRGIGEHGAWMAGLQYMGYGSIEETDVFGNVVGSFSPADFILSGTVSYDLFSNIRIGADVKFLYSSYSEFNAIAIAADLGINYYNPDNDFSLSVVGANIGGQVKRFENQTEKLPTDVRIGATFGLRHLPLRISLTGWNLLKWGKGYGNLMNHVVMGIDFVPSTKFYLSLGYNYHMRSVMQEHQKTFFSGFTAGAGFSASRFNLGAAIAQPATGSFTFMINFGLKINDLLN